MAKGKPLYMYVDIWKQSCEYKHKNMLCVKPKM